MLARLEKLRYRPRAERERSVLIAAAAICLIGMVATLGPVAWGDFVIVASRDAQLALRIGGIFLAVGALAGALLYVRSRLLDARATRRRLFDAARDGVFAINDRGFVTLCNAAAESIFGQSGTSLMRDPYPPLFSNIRSGKASLRELMMVGQGNVDDLFTYSRPDGTSAHLHLTLGRLRDEHGVTTGLVGTVQDVTDQVNERSRLAESEAEHRGLVWDVLNDTKVGLLIFDKQGRVVWVCQAMETYFGFKRGDVQGQPVEHVIEKRIRPRVTDGESVVDAILRSYREGHFLREATLTLRPDNRSERFLEYWSQPIRRGTYAGGRIEHFHDISHHVRSRRDMEQAHQRLETLQHVTLQLLPLRAPEAIATTTLEQLRSMIPLLFARVILLDDEQGSAEVLAISRHKPRWQTLSESYPLRREQLPRELWRGEVFTLQQIEDRKALGPLAPLLSKEPDTRTWMIVPLYYGDHLAALLDLGSPRPFAFDQDTQQGVQDIASHLAIALHNAHLLTDLQHQFNRLRALSGRLVDWQEFERRTLATELHDRIGQTLSGLNFTLAAVEQQCRDTEAPVQAARATVARLVQEVQDLSQDLRPPLLDDFGLIPALRWLVERTQTQRKMHVVLRQANVAGHRFNADIETAAYRVVQEALHHVAITTATPEVMVRLWTMPQKLYLDVEDAAPRPDSFTPPTGVRPWIAALRERVALAGGTLTVGTAAAGGLRLEVVLPQATTSDTSP